MTNIKRNGIFAAAVFAIALPNFMFAESLVEPSEFGDEGDGAEIYVQLAEDPSDEGSEENVGDEGRDESDTDIADENTDVAEDDVAGAVDENDVAEVEDTWTTSFGGGGSGGGGGGTDGEEPIYVEFSKGNDPVQRDDVPVVQDDLDIALQSGVAPTAPAEGNSAPILTASKRFDATLGINVHDKRAVAAQCAVLLDSGQTYQAFYKLYCD